jgi:hypothetical protein
MYGKTISTYPSVLRPCMQASHYALQCCSFYPSYGKRSDRFLQGRKELDGHKFTCISAATSMPCRKPELLTEIKPHNKHKPHDVIENNNYDLYGKKRVTAYQTTMTNRPNILLPVIGNQRKILWSLT